MGKIKTTLAIIGAAWLIMITTLFGYSLYEINQSDYNNDGVVIKEEFEQTIIKDADWIFDFNGDGKFLR